MSSNAMVLLPVVIEPLILPGQVRCFAARRNGWPLVSIPLAAIIAMCEGPIYRPLPDGLSANRKLSRNGLGGDQRQRPRSQLPARGITSGQPVTQSRTVRPSNGEVKLT